MKNHTENLHSSKNKNISNKEDFNHVDWSAMFLLNAR